MAKDILLADSIDRVAQVMRKHPRRDGDLRLERINPGIAAGQIHAAQEPSGLPRVPRDTALDLAERVGGGGFPPTRSARTTDERP
jgi:hypothetical protein